MMVVDEVLFALVLSTIVVVGPLVGRCEVVLFVVLEWWLVERLIFMFAVLILALCRTDGGLFGSGGGVGGSGGICACSAE